MSLKKYKDPVVAEVRKAREAAWKEYKRDPVAFRKENAEMQKRLGLKTATLRPAKISAQKLRNAMKRRKSRA